MFEMKAIIGPARWSVLLPRFGQRIEQHHMCEGFNVDNHTLAGTAAAPALPPIAARWRLVGALVGLKNVNATRLRRTIKARVTTTDGSPQGIDGVSGFATI